MSALTRRKSTIEEFQPTTIQIPNYYCDSKTLQGFEQAFRHPNELASFTFVATFRLIIQCISQSNIPSSLMGLIHLKSRFEINKPQNWLAPTTITISLESALETEKGKLYEVVTKLVQAGETTIINTNTFLDKKRGYTPTKEQGDNVSKKDTHSLGKPIAQVGLSLKTAWQYARLSGDFNPIHLHPWLAKKFGLKNVLIHGMFNAHFATNEALNHLSITNSSFEVVFNKPCFLPNQAYLKQYGDELNFGLFSTDGKDRFLKLAFLKKEE